MPKKIRFESFRYRFLVAADRVTPAPADPRQVPWREFVGRLQFAYENGAALVSWPGQTGRPISVPLDRPHLYTRGDTDDYAARQRASAAPGEVDPVKQLNEAFFASLVADVARAAGYGAGAAGGAPAGDAPDRGRLDTERTFHDAWADGEDLSSIDVRASAEACTAPEMRHIVKRLGDLRGKRLLDVGCGLGEASVYFALLGADVTASDLSPGMLRATSRLAAQHGVSVRTHLAAAEDLALPEDERFDVVYAGNLLHHVDVDRTVALMARHVAPGGRLVTWDPLAYNPAINVYRARATEVRTPDEHPLTRADLATVRRHFATVETRFFWLTTLTVFIAMALVERRDPNKERFWKVVIKEGERWRWLYAPLEALDRVLLAVVPPLGWLCWNVVIVASGPRATRS